MARPTGGAFRTHSYSYNGELDGMNKQATAEGTLNAMIETDAVTFYLGLNGNLYLGRKRQGVHRR